MTIVSFKCTVHYFITSFRNYWKHYINTQVYLHPVTASLYSPLHCYWWKLRTTKAKCVYIFYIMCRTTSTLSWVLRCQTKSSLLNGEVLNPLMNPGFHSGLLLCYAASLHKLICLFVAGFSSLSIQNLCELKIHNQKE